VWIAESEHRRFRARDQSGWSPMSCATGSCPGSASTVSAFFAVVSWVVFSVVFFAAAFLVDFFAVVFAVVFFAAVFLVAFFVVFFAADFLVALFAVSVVDFFVVFVLTASSVAPGVDSGLGSGVDSRIGATIGAAADGTGGALERRHHSHPATPAATKKSSNITRRIRGR